MMDSATGIGIERLFNTCGPQMIIRSRVGAQFFELMYADSPPATPERIRQALEDAGVVLGGNSGPGVKAEAVLRGATACLGRGTC